jgi:hypothetical protein
VERIAKRRHVEWMQGSDGKHYGVSIIDVYERNRPFGTSDVTLDHVETKRRITTGQPVNPPDAQGRCEIPGLRVWLTPL